MACLFHGNIVIPTDNPFQRCHGSPQSAESSPGECWLGPGLVIKINHVLAVNSVGIITHLEPADDFFARHSPATIQGQYSYNRLENGEFLCPGLIDLHIHAAQYAFAGTGTDRPLMGPTGWLETYTFPTEARMRDLQLARQVYDRVVRRTLSLGTTTAVYFATLDLEPTKVLVDVTLEGGQRALIGKVCMDRNAPDYYCQSLEQNLNEAVEIISYIRNHPSPRQQPQKAEGNLSSALTAIQPIPLILPLVTPRFIPSCSPALMDGLGDIARKYECHITSHISESTDEIEFSRHLAAQDYAGGSLLSDADVFHSHRLLTNKCIMAHGVHLSETDLDLMKTQGSAVAHCPLSNFFFAGGSLSCKRLMEQGIKIGLGTDIAGGYHPSISDASRMAVLASLSLQHQQLERRRIRDAQQHNTRQNGDGADDDHEPALDFRHSFYLATLGGAHALGLQDKIGTFQIGMEFDAIVLSSFSSSSSVEADESKPMPDIFPHDSLADCFQKLWNLGDDRNIRRVFVQGRKIK
jgi:guanine deaminase